MSIGKGGIAIPKIRRKAEPGAQMRARRARRGGHAVVPGLALLLTACAAPTSRQAAAPGWPTPTLEPSGLVASFPDSAPSSGAGSPRRMRPATPLRCAPASSGSRPWATAPSAQTLDQLSVHMPADEMTALRQRFATNGARVQASRLFTSLNIDQRLVEGIAWDSRSGRLFAATVVSRALLVREAQGWRAIENMAAGSLFGLAIDPRRRLLWAASGVVEQTPNPAGAFRGLIAVDLNTLRPVRRLAVPGEGSPADIALATDGTVYASDPNSGAIYRARPGDTALSVFVPPGRLRSPQGLVPSPDGQRLYVSDYGYGLAGIHLSDGNVTRLESDANTMLDGIDGLYPWRGGLLAIQNGTSPRRILWLTLSPDGERIAAARVLESNHRRLGRADPGLRPPGRLPLCRRRPMGALRRRRRPPGHRAPPPDHDPAATAARA